MCKKVSSFARGLRTVLKELVTNGERMRLTQDFLKKAVPEAQVIQGSLEGDSTFSLDSRTIGHDEIFVPINGEKTDGHNYLETALKKGRGAFVAFAHKTSFNKELFPNKLIVLVNSPQEALFKLAAAWRAQFSFPLVAVTGSVGKTSTKKLISTIFKEAGKNCFTAFGNQNTLFGISLNIARLDERYDVAVFEAGINKCGEMAKIAQLLQPTTAVITCIGHAHMEGLGSLRGIAIEKRDIFKFFKEDSIGIINGDQDLLSSVGYTHPVIKFGTKTTNQIQARKVKVLDNSLSFVLKIYGKRYPIALNHAHQGALNNMLAAAAVATHLGVESKVIAGVIQEPVMQERRFQTCPLKGYPGVLIDDAYNASPESMKAALIALQRLKTKGKKIAVLGDMLELGQNSPFWHRQIGRFLRKVPSLKHLILVGKDVQWTHKTAPVGVDVEIVPSWELAAQKLKGKLDTESVVLVKGSFGTNLSKLVEEFTDKTAGSDSV